MKSTDNTVFVRFVPPSADVTRFHLEDIFSNVGPIKKCSVIASSEGKGLGYGFVKFVSLQDAQTAAKTQNGKSFTVNDTPYKLKCELASTSTTTSKPNNNNNRGNTPTTATTTKKEPRKVESVVASSKQKVPPLQKEHEMHPKKRTVECPKETTDEEDAAALLAKRKRTARVIVRNVSFYAKESHIQKAMEETFGPVVEVNLPRVNDTLHRGFAFVTFASAVHAQRAVQPRETPLIIQKRPVAIDFSVSKMVHQQVSKKGPIPEKEEEEETNDADSANVKDSDDESDNDDAPEKSEEEEEEEEESDQEEEESEDEQSNGDKDEDEEEDETKSETKPAREAPENDDAVAEHRALFVRNLPFDATRHDLFELMSPFGHITGIFIVKDKMTGVAKGTAFCSFQKAESANKVLEATGANGAFLNQREGSVGDGGGLYLRGRRLFVDLAVDKRTATTLTVEKREDGTKLSGKDKRNLYLKMEGRVANQADGGTKDNSAWENLPESDQMKRQRAFAEKNTKLRSPLFFINPNRLSIRNLGKQVDEAMLKKLCVIATRRGLDSNIVSQEDQVAHWRAGGEMTTRDIMKQISDAKGRNPNGSVVPVFDDRNVKKFIPSVYIDRDFTLNKKEKAPSRGFGFVDFQYHAHALACLRELNNNPFYSAEYVSGGKKASEAKKNAKRKKKGDMVKGEFVNEDGRVQTPRLIVDFTVENKAKAKKQAEHRDQQQANNQKQRLEQKEKVAEKNPKKNKKSRGAVQREKKRKQSDNPDEENEEAGHKNESRSRTENATENKLKDAKSKTIKPPKKRKIDKEEQAFEKMVESYRAAFSNIPDGKPEKSQELSKEPEKRWFE